MKEICLSLWGTFWVFVDEVKQMLEEMTGLELLKISAKGFLYALAVVCCVFLIFSMILIGWVVTI